jgi:hypothetical protein
MSNAKTSPDEIILNGAPDEAMQLGSQPPLTRAQPDISGANPVLTDHQATIDGRPAARHNFAKTAKAKSGSRTTAAFSVAEEDWLTDIPQPGHYDALVIHASINPKSDITYLNLSYRIVDHAGRPYVISDMTVLDAKHTNPRHSQSAQGKGRVKAIMEANGKPLQFANIQAVPLELTGCRVRIAVGHKYIEDLPAPVVQGIVGPVEPIKDGL